MRLRYIDSAKGLAMLLIVWGHTVTFSDPISHWASAFKISLFYIATGLLLALRAEGGTAVKTPVKKLLLSTGVPYAFYSLLSLCAATVVMLAEKRDIDFLIDKLLLTLTLNGVSTLWFLPSIFFGRLIFERLMCRKLPVAVKAVGTIVLPVVLVLAANLISEVTMHKALHSLLLIVVKMLVALWFIGVGFEAGRLTSERKQQGAKAVAVAMMLLVCGSVAAFFNKGVDLNNGLFGSVPVLFFLSGALCSLGIVGVFAYICERKPCPVTEFAGRNSLFIMVTHLPLYIVPVVSVGVSALITEGDSVFFNYLRVTVTFVIVLVIEWVLIFVKKKLTERVKNYRVAEFLKYI